MVRKLSNISLYAFVLALCVWLYTGYSDTQGNFPDIQLIEQPGNLTWSNITSLDNYFQSATILINGSSYLNLTPITKTNSENQAYRNIGILIVKVLKLKQVILPTILSRIS